MRRTALLFAVAAAAVLAQPAPARRIAPDEQFTTKWLVQPGEASAAPVSVPPGGLILKQRLLPTGLARLKEAYTGPTPAESLAAGAEMVRATGPDGAVYCSTGYRAQPLAMRLLIGGPDRLRQVCLMDSDNDGRFDSVLKGTSNLRTLPSAFGILPKVPATIAPIPYEEAAPESFSELYYVGVQYEGQAKIGTLRRFHLAFGSEGNWDQISDNLFTKRDSDLPRTLEVMGAAITILGGEGRNVVAKVDRPFPPQPFGVYVSTFSY